MKKVRLIILFIAIIGFQSCKKEEVIVEPELLEIKVSRTTILSITTLWWSKVEDVSWYFVYFGEAGEDMQEYPASDSGDGTYVYVNTDLSPNTTYEAIVRGKDQEINGTVVAESEKITITTGSF